MPGRGYLRDAIVKLPNLLTVSRLLMAFVMAVFLTIPVPFGKTLGLLTFLLAALSDYWDGRLARRSGGITAFGQLMDPLADKILVCAAFICFVAMDQIVPAWIVIIIIAREFMVTGLRMLAAGQGQIISAGRWGKHKTAWQIVVIGIILVGECLRDDILPRCLPPADLPVFLSRYFDRVFTAATMVIAILVAMLTVVSGTVYFWRYRGLVLTHA